MYTWGVIGTQIIRIQLNWYGGIRDGKVWENKTWERSNHFEDISVCKEFSALVTDFKLQVYRSR